MKLRNKKTGEIVIASVTRVVSGVDFDCGQTLAELNEEWEDYEEPKTFFTIYYDGTISEFMDGDDEQIRDMKAIGNYFGTKEEAELVVRKLKAWKRLKDKGIVIRKLRHNENGGEMYWSCPSKTGISDKQIWLDLDLLFGGEE